jgi:hypothetical protein
MKGVCHNCCGLGKVLKRDKIDKKKIRMMKKKVEKKEIGKGD